MQPMTEASIDMGQQY